MNSKITEKVLPTSADFVDCTTSSGLKLHLAEKGWRHRTLCGHSAHDHDSPRIAALEACRQCAKSKARRIEGRSS
jgi:hypothetical protein